MRTKRTIYSIPTSSPLNDPTLWQEPSDGLEDRIVTDIAQERRAVVPIGRPRRLAGSARRAAIGALRLRRSR